MRRTTWALVPVVLCVVAATALADPEISPWTVASGLHMPRLDAGGGWITYHTDLDTSVYYLWGDSHAYHIDTASYVSLSAGMMWDSNSHPRTDGNTAVWVYAAGGQYEIWARNLGTGAQGAVFTGLTSFPSWLDVSGSRIAWVDVAAKTLHSYDLVSGSHETVSGFAQSPRELKLDGNIAVWEDSRNTSGGYYLDIWGYDFATGTEFQVTGDHANDFAPAISGNTVVWRSYEGGVSKIEGYDMAAGQRFVVSDTVVGASYVAIDGNLVAWSERRDIAPQYTDEESIWARSLLGGDEFMIDWYRGYNYSIAAAGDIVAWENGTQVRAAQIRRAELYVAGGGFDDPAALGDWSATGDVSLITDPVDPGNTLLAMTTASPVTISQLVSTPVVPCSVDFDYRFLTTDGWLEVYLDGTLLRTLLAPSVLVDHMTFYDIAVWQPWLLGRSDVELAFIFDSSAAGQTLLLDNIDITTGVPEPATAALLGLSMGTLLIGRKKRK